MKELYYIPSGGVAPEPTASRDLAQAGWRSLQTTTATVSFLIRTVLFLTVLGCSGVLMLLLSPLVLWGETDEF